jgi:type IV pilus assembly protein PilX
MNSRFRPRFFAQAPAAARGFSLIVSLILLLLVTLVALASMRGVALQSRMSATTHDRNLAFQSAETALRDAEAQAAAITPANFPANGCVEGLCAQPAATATARWNDSAFAGWQDTGTAVSDNAVAPQAIVENMGTGANWLGCMQQIPREPNCVTPRYRVTARSQAADRAAVIVQTDQASQ